MSGFGGSRGRLRPWGRVPVIRRSGESQADARRRMYGKANAQARAREHRGSPVEKLAHRMRGACSMRGAERRQGDLQLAIADFDVAGGGKEFVQKRSAFLFGARTS